MLLITVMHYDLAEHNLQALPSCPVEKPVPGGITRKKKGQTKWLVYTFLTFEIPHQFNSSALSPVLDQDWIFMLQRFLKRHGRANIVAAKLENGQNSQALFKLCKITGSTNTSADMLQVSANLCEQMSMDPHTRGRPFWSWGPGQVNSDYGQAFKAWPSEGSLPLSKLA